MKGLIGLVAGLLFGAGLALGGMTQPTKVLGFLDLAGHWDPSLAFVMGGGLLVAFPAFTLAQRRRTWPCSRRQPCCADGAARESSAINKEGRPEGRPLQTTNYRT